MRLLAIDPGNVESALLIYDTDTCRPVWWEKVPNDDALDVITSAAARRDAGYFAVEMIASYGMAVGKTVFETCVWIGRFIECWDRLCPHAWQFVYRMDVKMHLCHSAKAKDANVRQALIDMFGPGKDAAIGKKASPGPLYGLSGDGWAALGVAVTVAATMPAQVAA